VICASPTCFITTFGINPERFGRIVARDNLFANLMRCEQFRQYWCGYPLDLLERSNQKTKCGTESCNSCGDNQANPRNINDEYAKQANFESDAYPVDQQKLTLTVFPLRFVLRARVPSFPEMHLHLTSCTQWIMIWYLPARTALIMSYHIWNSEPASFPIGLHGIGVICVCSIKVGLSLR
jgi:hypothetical protein